MRSQFPKLVEDGRVDYGDWKTSAGDTFGLFFVVHPRTRRRFKVIVGDGEGWDHVSVSLPKRCPSWDEMCWIKDLFFGPSETVIQYHPAIEEYVDIHPHCLHLWRPQGETLPKPPLFCV